MSKHVVIIGSGLGGLSCGYILAKKGYRVTILEKNVQIGGCLQTFVRDGVKFETGMHYIGNMEENQIQHRFFRYFNLINSVQLSRLDVNGYDVISLSGKRYPIANGEDNFIETLARFFPEEIKNIRYYCEYLNKITDYSVFYNPEDRMNIGSIANSKFMLSVKDFVTSVTTNKLLQGVFVGQSPLYGSANKTPLYIHALVHDNYNKNAFRIVGGSSCIAGSLADSIRAMGGEIYTGRKVIKVNCDNEKATRVTIEGETDELRADVVISDIHPIRLLEMLDTSLIRNVYRTRLRSIENTPACFTIYIRFKDRTLPYQNYNLFHSDVEDVWAADLNYKKLKFPVGFLYTQNCSSINQKYADGGVVFSYMDFKEVERWKGTPIGRRGAEYEEFKRQKAEMLLEMLERQQPGTRAAIKSYYTSSPLTYLDYTGTEEGSMYGYLIDSHDLIGTTVIPQTKIPNLFLTGQNTNIHGMLGVMIGAVLTARNLVDTSDIIELLHER
ncbi:MAG: NAD(P)/FAD-dependent oxidoreductase [Bacteroides sp.]|nr:NAD(P)/FAD-dependent oxidoreductase [Bacteroides sp.]MCM1084869.1 NAD(P)/FAD-dependent oxidoreductase [Bacteroides sp.]